MNLIKCNRATAEPPEHYDLLIAEGIEVPFDPEEDIEWAETLLNTDRIGVVEKGFAPRVCIVTIDGEAIMVDIPYSFFEGMVK